MAIGCALVLTACSAAVDDKMSDGQQEEQEMESAYHKIEAEEAKKMMDEQDVVVVDVRTAEEYAEGHVPGAVLIPLQEIGDEPPGELPDKGADILVYCRSGRRSKQASDKLVELGYENVYDFGGIMDWPYDIEDK